MSDKKPECPACGTPVIYDTSKQGKAITRCPKGCWTQPEPADALPETINIAEQLFDAANNLLTKKFGPEYAKRNPHVFSNVLNTHRSVYLSLQEKKKTI